MSAKVAGIDVEAIEYNQRSATVRTQFDQEKTPASMAVIETLADVMGADPTDLTPLHATVDPDALDAFVRVRDRTIGDTRVTFTHEDTRGNCAELRCRHDHARSQNPTPENSARGTER